MKQEVVDWGLRVLEDNAQTGKTRDITTMVTPLREKGGDRVLEI